MHFQPLHDGLACSHNRSVLLLVAAAQLFAEYFRREATDQLRFVRATGPFDKRCVRCCGSIYDCFRLRQQTPLQLTAKVRFSNWFLSNSLFGYWLSSGSRFFAQSMKIAACMYKIGYRSALLSDTLCWRSGHKRHHPHTNIQMRWRMTANFLATATVARRPLVLTKCMPRVLSGDMALALLSSKFAAE